MAILHKKEKRSPRSNFTVKEPNLYIIIGDPIALARPRLTRSHVWDPQKELKLISGLSLAQQHGTKPLYKGTLEIDVVFFLVPSNAKARKERDGLLHTMKPDLDNLCKFLLDISNTVLFHDDCQVASLVAVKRWSTQARTEFTVSELD